MFETFDKTEVLRPKSIESALGDSIEMTEAAELGGYKVGDVIQFKRVNALPFGQIDFLLDIPDDHLDLQVIGISSKGTLVVRLTAVDMFIGDCTVEQLNASRA